MERVDRERDLEAYYTDLTPLPVEEVRELLRWTLEDLAEVAAVLRAPGRRASPGAVLRGYVPGYPGHSVAAGRVFVVPSWSAALRGNPRVGGFLDNASFRMGGPGTYGRVPNLAEIEAALGHDDTGHIGYLPPVERPRREARTPPHPRPLAPERAHLLDDIGAGDATPDRAG